MKRKLLYMTWLFAVLFMASCESLEETYDEFAGNGKIRYTGKCSDLEVLPGWGRLKVKWRGNIDAMIDSVKITWQAEDEEVPNVMYRPPVDAAEQADLMDSVMLEGLGNSVYTVTVSNVAKDGTESLVETQYARPYTQDHEDLRSFTRGIVNFYPVKNNLVMVLDEDNANIFRMVLTYTGTDGEQHEWNIKEHMSDMLEYYNEWFMETEYYRDYFVMLPDVDFSKPVTVKRDGMLTGCIDTIYFAPEVLDIMNERIWSSDFSRLMAKKYGPGWESYVNTLEEIELDYNIASFRNLFYFPNLKKVILGKNRYMLEDEITDNISTTDPYQALMTLQFLKEVQGVTTERYNLHYISQEELASWGFEAEAKNYYLQMMESLGKIDAGLVTERNSDNLAEMPEITPLDTTGWVVTCSDTTFNGKKEGGAGWLLDQRTDRNEYCFEPGVTTGVTIIEVTIDMQEAKELHGFKVVQPHPDTRTNLRYLLSSLQVEVSQNGYDWQQATYEDGSSNIGNALGETTFIYVPEEYQSRPVRYIRLTMTNQQTNSTSSSVPLFSLRLGAFIPF